MYKNEEEKLNDYKNSYEHISIPESALNDAILAGFQKAKSEKVKKHRVKKWLVSFTVAALLLIGFGSSIRMSPAFAGYVSTLPGMEKIVELISDNKGLLSAIENDYYQKLDMVEEKNGIKVVLDGVIADDQGLVVFYTLHSKEREKELSIESANIISLDGQQLNPVITYGNHDYSEEGKTSHSGTLEYYFEKPIKSRQFKIEVEVKGASEEKFSIPIQLKNVQVAKTYELNKTIHIEHQKIEIKDVKISPLRAAVHVKMDAKNTKKILEIEDLRLVDENGETWGKIINGFSASVISADETIIYLQSNYFREPKELYLMMNKIQAIEKDQAYLIVDTEKKQIIKQPAGNRISEVRVNGDEVSFIMNTGQEHHYFPFGGILDGNGEVIDYREAYSTDTEDKGVVEVGVIIPELHAQKNPISLELRFFPAWIEGNAKVKIE